MSPFGGHADRRSWGCPWEYKDSASCREMPIVVFQVCSAFRGGARAADEGGAWVYARTMSMLACWFAFTSARLSGFGKFALTIDGLVIASAKEADLACRIRLPVLNQRHVEKTRECGEPWQLATKWRRAWSDESYEDASPRNQVAGVSSLRCDVFQHGRVAPSAGVEPLNSYMFHRSHQQCESPTRSREACEDCVESRRKEHL